MSPNIGSAQRAHIRNIRNELDDGPKTFFKDKDWRRVEPVCGKFAACHLNKKALQAEAFYVRPVAVWLPHLLIPNHIPSCPHCGESKSVNVNSAVWIQSPILLYGIPQHRYLDTKYYPCSKCNKQFTGYNKKSMQLDSNQYFGFFNFYLGNGYAVDEDLYSLIVNQATTQSTTAIERHLKQMANDAYTTDQQLYYYAIGIKKIKTTNPNFCRTDFQQRTLPSMTNFFVQPVDENHATLLRRKNFKADAVTKLELQIADCNRNLATDVVFADLVKLKGNRNLYCHKAPPFPGFGIGKIEKCIQRGIKSAFELQTTDISVYKELKPEWKRLVEEHYQAFETEKKRLEGVLRIAQEEYEQASDEVVMYTSMHEVDQMEENNNNPQQQPEEAVAPAVKPPAFSKFNDKEGYNGRVISKFRIDSIVATEFHHRKSVMDAKMVGLQAAILKIDFNYKLASKIRVWTKQGASFSPYKCIITVQNEDAMTVYWKAMKHSESITEIQSDFVSLRDRLNRNANCSSDEQSVKVIYVDNCCSTGNKLKEIFPGAEIKLDPFHWLQRWNDILIDSSTSPLSGIFRALMSRAIFNIEATEFERAKHKLTTKLNRRPTFKEIKKEANAVIPCPTILRSNIEAVLQYVFAKDAETELTLSTWNPDNTSAKPKRFLKNMRFIRDNIQAQLSHIDKGCLSDPDPSVVNLFRFNEKTQVTYCSRGTNTNERDNLDLSKLMTATHIGIHRAERIIYNFFEQSNHRKAINRLGAIDHGTYRTEKLSLLNSQALSVGFSNEELPYYDISTATMDIGDRRKEYIGFQYTVSKVHEVSNPTQARPYNNQQYDPAEPGDAEADLEDASPPIAEEELAMFLEEAFATEFDVDVEVGDIPADRDPVADQRILDLERADRAVENDRVHRRDIEQQMALLLPEGIGYETTMQAFERLSNQQPWIPFNSDTTSTREIDSEERRLFTEFMSTGRYNRHAAPSARKGFKSLEKDWNAEVASRYKAWSTGDQSVLLVNRKSCTQLVQHFDRVREQESIAASLATNPNDKHRATLDDNLRRNRQQIPPTHLAHFVQPPEYPTTGVAPFGNPMTLNPVIAAGALQTLGPNQVNNLPAAAPYAVRARTIRKDAPRKVFRSRKYCLKCGFLRSNHVVADEGVAERCRRNYCAKCGETKQHHSRSDGFGPNCTKPSCLSSPENDWHEIKDNNNI